MRIQDLPIFTVDEVESDGSQLKGRASRWQWVGEGHIAFMLVGSSCLIQGKFRNVDEATRRVSFAATDASALAQIGPRACLPFLDGYWGERAVLVLDTSLGWEEAAFAARDAVEHHTNGKTEVITGGWDHEHCAICWANISEHENKRFMKSSRDDPICLDCFSKYVRAKSLDFIEGLPQTDSPD